MRYMIISDIHGSSLFLEKALDIFKKESYDFLIILGDILYHGPRNPIPEGHNPQAVVKLLNDISDKIIACRGNCEAEVDQMLLNFPCMSDYSQVINDDVRLFATHGHLYSADNFPKSAHKQIFLYGHNPGSITPPKENRPHTYAIYENDTLTVYDLNQSPLASISF